MHTNDIKQRSLITFGLPSADVDFLAMLQKFIEREVKRPLRIVRDWLTIRIDGVDQCVIRSETSCRLEFEGGTSKVEIVGRDAEGDVVIATYLPTYDGPKTEAWKVSLPWGDEVSCTFEYDDGECVRIEAKRIVKPKFGEKHAELTREPQQGFFAFDRAYLEKLRNGDPATEHHFFVYFKRLLHIKMRARMISPDKLEGLKQETFIRVLAALRKEGAVRQPERFGAFVYSMCNDALQEYYRSSSKNQQMDETHEMADKVLDLEEMTASKQYSERVRKILSALPARDRELLRAVFLEEKDKDALCRKIGVDRDYLRVLLHRAKNKFKDKFKLEFKNDFKYELKDEWANLPPVWDNLLNED